MKRKKAIYKAKSLAIENPNKDLLQVLNSSQEAEALLSALLYARGFSYVFSNNKGNQLVFLAGNSKSDLTEKLNFNKKTQELSGLYKDEIIHVYAIVDAIENRSSAIDLYPFDKRVKEINSLCREIGVSPTDYEITLRNWN